MRINKFTLVVALFGALSAANAEEHPVTSLFGSGKLPLTGGLPNIDGVGGGGITASALIAGYGTEGQIGGFAQASKVKVDDFELDTQSIGLSLFNRFEVSFAESQFNTQQAGARLGLGENYEFNNSSLNAKLRLYGDAILDQDSWVPQISLGWQRKESDNAPVLALIGAGRDTDSELYLSATKLVLRHGILINATARHTRANQNGILGFGGDQENDKQWLAETFVAYLITDKLASGIEYRQQPNNLGFARQDDWKDIFLLYTPTKHLTLTAAYVDLGDIALQRDQRGFYTSLTLQF